MQTRTTVCENIIKDFEGKQGGVRVKEQDVFSSSALAVAMEYLGLVKDPDIRSYCSSRDGILKLNGKDEIIEAMTLREFLSTLPEEECEPKAK